MSVLNIQITVPQECEHYLESSARLRKTSRSALLRAVLGHVLRDQLILSILDDDDKPSVSVSEGKRKTYTNRTVVPTVAVNRPQRPNAGTVSFRRYKDEPKSKSQMQEELAQAVRNTASMQVSE